MTVEYFVKFVLFMTLRLVWWELLGLTQAGRLAGGEVEAVLRQSWSGPRSVALCVRGRRRRDGHLGAGPAALTLQLQTIVLRLQLLDLQLSNTQAARSVKKKKIRFRSRLTFCASSSDLHAVHGLSELVQLMRRAESLQTDIGQLHLLLPELTAQLHHRLRLAVQTLRQPEGVQPVTGLLQQLAGCCVGDQ